MFFVMREMCHKLGIDVRAAFDAAAKKVVRETCTGDAAMQALSKRVKKIREAKDAADIATPKSSTKKGQVPGTPEASKTADGKASSSKAEPAAAKPVKSPLATPKATPKRASRGKTARGAQGGAAAPSTPDLVKAKRKDFYLATPSRVNDESDSEYTESPEKAKNKRIRASVTKAAKKSGKKAKKQFSDSESDSEYEVADTPSKKSADKSIRSNSVKNSGPSAPIIQPGSARKTLPQPVQKVETVEAVEQPESGEDSEAESNAAVEEAQSPNHDISDSALLPMNLVNSPSRSHNTHEGVSRHDSLNNSPPSFQAYIANSLDDFPLFESFSGGQSVHNDHFGGPLFGGSHPSSHRNQFGTSSIGMSSGGLNSMIPSTMGSTGISQYFDFQK